MMGKSSLRAVLGTAFSRRDDPYAGGDLELARRLGQILASASTVIALLLLPLAPPTAAIGQAGWVVGGGLVLISVGSVALERFTGTYTWNHILVANYAGIVQIGTAQWLAGVDAPYKELFVLSVVYVAGVHPPRRMLVFLTAVGAVTVVPLFFVPWDPLLVGSTVALVMIWSALSVAAAAAMLASRLNRIGEIEAGLLARADSLTGLGNRRAFDEALVTEIARSHRKGAPLTLMLGDLDSFKAINDRFNHLVGDDVLRGVAAQLRDTIRLEDRCFRWGGDEFAALLADTDAEAASRIAERVVLAVAGSCRLPNGERVAMTCAFAVLGEGMTGVDLLARADQALLDLKESRRLSGAAASSFAPGAPPAGGGTPAGPTSARRP
jgi:diguanylate cyclase (GGDEF)-like protein